MHNETSRPQARRARHSHIDRRGFRYRVEAQKSSGNGVRHDALLARPQRGGERALAARHRRASSTSVARIPPESGGNGALNGEELGKRAGKREDWRLAAAAVGRSCSYRVLVEALGEVEAFEDELDAGRDAGRRLAYSEV